MNLAQLIDPEWVRARFPERSTIKRPREEDLGVSTGRDGLDHRERLKPTGDAPAPRTERLDSPERSPGAIAAPVPARRVEGGFPLRGMTRRIAGVLAASSRPLVLAVVERALGNHAPSTATVSALLSGMVKRGFAAKSGQHRPFAYSLTDQGRRRLK